MTDHDDPPALPSHIVEALRAPAPVDPSARERHLTAAMAAFDDLPTDDTEPAAAPIVPMRRRRLVRIAAAAAAIVITGGVVWASAGRSSTPRQAADQAIGSTAGSGPSRRQAHAPEAAPVPAAPSSPAGEATFAPAGSDAASPAATKQELAPQLSRPGAYAGAANATTSPTNCPTPASLGSLQSVEPVVVDETTRLVYEFVRGPDGEQRETIEIDPVTCARI